MWPDHRSVLNRGLLEVAFVLQFNENTKVQKGGAIVDAFLSIGKNEFKGVLVGWVTLLIRGFMFSYLNGSILYGC